MSELASWRLWLIVLAVALAVVLLLLERRHHERWRDLMYTRLGPLPTLAFMICAFGFFAWTTAKKPRVLILHSYATDFSWVRDINVGIDRVLSKKAYSVRYHYMDTKRHPSREHLRRAGQQAQRIVRDWEPDVLLTVDDNAQEWVAKYFINDPEIDIVFTGVNAEPAKYGFDKALNATGLLERIPFDALKAAFLDILPPDRRRLVHYSDSSPTSHAIHQEMESFDWDPIEVVTHEEITTFDQWQRRILGAAKVADFLMITHYHTIRRSPEDESIVPPREVMEWTLANTPIPDIGCWGFYVHDGGMVALGLSPYETGQVAARMATEIIDDGIKPSDIPVDRSHYYLVYVREPRLRQFGLDLPPVYASFAHATDSYYTE